MDYKKYTSRRFVLASLSLLISSALVWFGKIPAGEYKDIVIACVAIYIAGNTTQKIQGTATTITESN